MHGNSAQRWHKPKQRRQRGVEHHSQSGDINSIRFLARYGVKLDEKNARGQTPCDLAVIKGFRKTVEWLDSNVTNLQILCRRVVRKCLGPNSEVLINRLPLPKRLKVIVNFGIPYRGWSAKIIPPLPWENDNLSTAPSPDVHAFCVNTLCLHI
eukprot:m.200078 g.200078  ORF g.200078 m.200078 type:complete len:153 (+) comp39583_c0_seq2:160-618(+)